MPTPLGPDWYSLDEVADRYGVTRRTVERWAKAGRIAVTRLAGTTRRISRAALFEFEHANRTVTLPPILRPDDRGDDVPARPDRAPVRTAARPRRQR